MLLIFTMLLGMLPIQTIATAEKESITENLEAAHEHEYVIQVTNPTCTERGYTTYTCDCGDRYVDSYVDASDHSYSNGICIVCDFGASEQAYTHAHPENQGVSNAIARAYQLTDVEWTPQADMPGVNKINGEYTVITYKAGETYKGVPYSGVIATDTYLGLNVSLESFLTALENTNSVLYTENLFNTNPKSATYFGTVCSKFAQYVLDIPGSYNTSNVANIPGVDTIAMPGQFTVDDIKLGDIVLHTVNHTSVCTDILYDANGNVAFVEISEAVFPQVRRKLWSPEEFYAHFSGYRLCRYQYIHDVPAAPAEISSLREYALMPRFGDKYNYKVSSTKGIVDILESGYSKAVVLRDGVVISEIALNGASTFSFDRSVPGYLEMYLEKEDGTRSNSVYACVVKSSVTVTDTSQYGNGKLIVSFDGTSGTPLYVQVGSGQSVFCSVEGKENTAEISFKLSRVSSQKVRVAYQNEFGIYLSSWVGFTADTNPSTDPLLSQAQYWDGHNITPSSHIPTVQEGKEGFWTYTMIPVEENTTYYSWGATRMWYLDANGNPITTINAYKDCSPSCQFTIPEGVAYVSIAYSPTLLSQGTETMTVVSSAPEEDEEEKDDEKEETPTNPSTDPYLSLGEYWDGYTLTPTNSTPIVQDGKCDYWTYTMIPVKGDTTYYSEGANRMWFFDANKNPISTYNALTQSPIRCQFTTPANACYVSVTYAPSVVEKGTETMEKVVVGEIFETLALRYDDHYDVTGKTVEILDAGTPTSYKVGSGIVEGALDDAVITLAGNYLIATGIGTAKVRMDGVLYEITVEPAPISLFMITGHSMGAGQQGNKDQSVICPAGQVYSSHGTTNLGSTTAGVGISYAAGSRASNINAFTADGTGTIGEGSALAYEWNRLTGEKVWVLNTAVGGSCLAEWIPGTTNYSRAVTQFRRAQQILSNEIRAGHYTLSHMGLVYHNGANFSYKGVTFTQQDLKTWYDAMWTGFRDELSTDLDGNGETETVSFLGFVPIWTKSAGISYTQDEPAGLFMAASGEYDGMFTASVIGKDWLTNANVAACFPEIDYQTQNGQPIKQPEKTSEVFSSDNVHYLQVGYNAVGMDIAKNIVSYLQEDQSLTQLKLVSPGDLSEISDQVTLNYGQEFVIVPLTEPITFHSLTFTAQGNIRITYPLVISATGNGTGKLTVSCEGKLLREIIFTCTDAPQPQTLALRYDDHYDVTGKTVEILDAGKPASYQVGYGVEENTVFDTAVVTLRDNTLVATGIGTAQVKIDGVLYEVTVTAAPISLLLLIGQSNMRGSEGNADQSIVCPDGMVYATFGDDRGDAAGIMNVNNATKFAASALTGPYSSVNVEGTTEHLSFYPINSLTAAGAGTFGPDSGFAYEWVKQTGEKVWIVNAAHGGSSIKSWAEGAVNFRECDLLFSACQETLRKEIAAGHFTLSHMGYFWCQGCSDYSWTAEEYVQKYLAMHEGLKRELAFDHDSDPSTADRTLEFAGIIPIRAGHDYNDGYREGTYTDTTGERFYESFQDLQMTGPRVAQYWMTNNPELPEIWNVCNIGEDWVWMPDGTNGVTAYFQAHYPGGTVDYTTQVKQSASWYTPTTPKAVHDSIHYNQIGYNEWGREAARNALILLGEIEAPEVETKVELLTWDGYTPASEVTASVSGNSGTLVVPKVYPVWKSKEVTYSLSEGLLWNYYDLLVTDDSISGKLTSNAANQVVTVTGHTWSDWETLYEPSPEGPGQQQRVCADCGLTESKTIKGVWQIYALNDHLLELPEYVCCDTNLWAALPHESVHFTSGKTWGNTGTPVTSITIPVNAGDKLYATSWKKAVENGHATSNGIRVTFFNASGIAKTMGPGQTDREFYANGGYLIAPEGTIAINIAMWYDSEDYEVYILSREHCYEKGICLGCGAADPDAPAVLELRFDDHYDITGKTAEIIDAGKPTSYKVGYGVPAGTLDDAVVTLEGSYLVATGIGKAQVKIDGVLYEVTVTAAPLNVLLLIGQSNMQGSEGNAEQSIVCPEGMVYATYGDRYTMTTSNATNFAPSALTGTGSAINVNGTTANIEDWPVYLLNEAGNGKIGPDSGFAYEWVKQTGQKVWVINAAHGGTAISLWQENGKEYKECKLLFNACMETLRAEIEAGHFTLSHMGYFWCQGCSDYSQTAQWYVEKYLAMHDNLKTELAFSENVTFEFAGIIPVRAGNESYTSYRQGVYADTTNKAYYESFKDLRFTGPRVAQYWMTNNPDLPDIWNVCNIGEDWVWMPDGTNGVTEYFQAHYPGGTVDYTTQVQQSASWYTPTTPKDVHDSIHYNQIGYNEVGREAARNALIMLGEIEAPEVKTKVELLTWDGYTPASNVPASTTGSSGTLVVPKVYPVWKSKEVTYQLSDGLTWNYYDLLADGYMTTGTLTANGMDSNTVTVTARELSSYRWDLENGILVSTGETENPATRLEGITADDLFLDTRYKLEDPILLLHDEKWILEWKMTGPWYDDASTGSQKLFCEDSASATPNSMCLLIKGNENRITLGYYGTTTHISYGFELDAYGISMEDTHIYRLANHIAEDGTNTIYLFVDGVQIGPMTRYFTGTSGDMGQESNGLSGRNIAFGYMGTPKYLLDNGTIEYISVVETGASQDIHFHDWTDWTIIRKPGPDGPGEEKRCCPCGVVESREILSIWQTTTISQHWNELPEDLCCGVNLWAVLEHDPKYYVNSKGDWDYHSSRDVPSVTIAVNPGDKIFATSFGKASENGHGSSNGIRVTWFGIDGVIKTTDPAGTYAEFTKNGGYLIAPEGAVAFNIPMWGDSDSYEIYILNLSHDTVCGICSACGKDTHSWSAWETVTLPSMEGPGEEKRTCVCGETETRRVDGAWQKYDLANHMQTMPENYCCATNLWTALDHDAQFLYYGSYWAVHESGTVYSVTIPVKPGDWIFATSFQEYGKNGNGYSTTSGIRVTFLDAYGVAKTLDPAGTYAEFTKNGGYLIAPEGTVAVNIPMWNGSDSKELYILNREHIPGTAVKEETADGSYELAVYCTCCGKELSREAVAGHIPGDITGDGVVNNKDLTRLFKYLTGFDVEVVEAALDINGDGSVNNKDQTRLFRYLSGYDVDIY